MINMLQPFSTVIDRLNREKHIRINSPMIFAHHLETTIKPKIGPYPINPNERKSGGSQVWSKAQGLGPCP
ncbi:MAG: hypothetical protein RMI78_02370, partial [Nitrososphaerota archaeon]|nr:hypothetical protein [Nitrososphaerota archaeon]